MNAPQLPPPAPPTPRRRVARTALQAVIAGLVAVPTAIALTPLEGSAVAWTVGIANAFVVIASAVQNALDKRASRG